MSESSSLRGKRIVITRALEDAEDWEGRVRARGAEPVILPCLETELVDDASVGARLRELLQQASWLALTSRRAVQALQRLKVGPLPSRVRLACVGPATAAAAKEAFGRSALVANPATGLALGRQLRQVIEDEAAKRAHVVIAAAREGRNDLENALLPGGIRVDCVAVYHTLPTPPPSERGSLEGTHAVLVTSPSAITGLMNQVDIPASVHVVTIGPTTTSAAHAAGLKVAAEARAPTLEAMLEAVP